MKHVDFVGSNPTDWIEVIPPYSINTVREILSTGLSYEDAANAWLSSRGVEQNAPFGTANSSGKSFFDSVRAEFSKLVCGDPNYKDIRADVAKYWDQQKTVVVSTVAAFIGSQVGIAAAVLMPVIALLFAAAASMGVQAWCAMDKEF